MNSELGELRDSQILRQRIGIVLAPLAFILLLLFPPESAGITAEAQKLLAVAVLTIILWISEAIPLPITSLLAPALAVVLGVAPAVTAFAPFAHPLIFLFLGGFMLAHALSVHGFDRRVALWLLSRSYVKDSPARLRIAVAALAFFLSMWISNTATAAMLLPIILGIMGALHRVSPKKDHVAMDRFGEGMLITMAYASSLGGISTPVGTAPNLVAIAALEDVGISIDFLQWMIMALPLALLALVLLLVVVHYMFPCPQNSAGSIHDYVFQEKQKLGRLSSAEKRIVFIFCLTILGWIFPSLLRIFGSQSLGAWGKSHFPEGITALLGASLLFVIGSGPSRKTKNDEGHSRPTRKALLSWEEAVQIDWGTLFLLGGGLALGKLAEITGLAEVIGQETVGLVNPDQQWLLLIMACALVIYLTEVVSNTATINMMLPILVPIAVSNHENPLPLIVAVTMAASFAFMLPVSTPPNAIVYGSRRVRLSTMLRLGFILDILGLILLCGFAAWLLPYLQP